MSDFKLERTWMQARLYLLWLALPLIAGILIAALIPQPVVGVINVSSAIYSDTANTVIKQFDYARAHPEVRAIVLVLDSPGGTVVDTESIYFELLKLRKDKPVVTSINLMAASGAYYLTAGTDYAFAKPTSDVGNIGVIGYLPSAPTIYEGIISTGPYKLWGSPRDAYMRQIESIKEGFYGAVKAGRGDRLKADRDVVLSGKLWLGAEALQLGLIDELGSQSDAIQKAASLAHISNYKVVDLYAAAGLTTSPGPFFSFFAEDSTGATLPYPREAGIYMLYIPPMTAEQK